MPKAKVKSVKVTSYERGGCTNSRKKRGSGIAQNKGLHANEEGGEVGGTAQNKGLHANEE